MLVASNKICELCMSYLKKTYWLSKYLEVTTRSPTSWVSLCSLPDVQRSPFCPLHSPGLWLCWGPLNSTSVCFHVVLRCEVSLVASVRTRSHWDMLVSLPNSLIYKIVPSHHRFWYMVLKPLQIVPTKVYNRLLKCIKASKQHVKMIGKFWHRGICFQMMDVQNIFSSILNSLSKDGVDMSEMFCWLI